MFRRNRDVIVTVWLEEFKRKRRRRSKRSQITEREKSLGYSPQTKSKYFDVQLSNKQLDVSDDWFTRSNEKTKKTTARKEEMEKENI